jgi:hypothetical protein
VVTSDPTVALKLALSGFRVAVLTLWMAKRADVRKGMLPIVPLWVPNRSPWCVLFSGPARL